jgi:predicted NBD/HSP70 family sugar kinase
MLKYIEDAEISSGCGPLLAGEHASSATLPLRQQVFEHVRANGQAARADITRALQISAGSATTLVADLIASGLLREVATDPRAPARDVGRGRPRVALEVVGEAAFVIGIKLEFKRHSAVLCDFAGQVVGAVSVPASERRRSTDDLLDEVTSLIDKVVAESGRSAQDIRAVGLGLPGIVDADSGLVRWSSLLHDGNVDLVSAFASRFHAPLFTDNDTNMLTLAELWFGGGRQKADFAVVTIENGVGMGLVVNNQLYRGTHGMGLELGHTKVHLDGALCRCGQRGCLEAYLGDYAISREAATALDVEETGPRGQDAVLHHLHDAAKIGHAGARAVFQRAGRYLAVGLSNIIQLFDPPLIILSGKLTQSDYYSDEVLAEMEKLTLSDGRRRCTVELRHWDDLEWARGAAVPALTALTAQMAGAA